MQLDVTAPGPLALGCMDAGSDGTTGCPGLDKGSVSLLWLPGRGWHVLEDGQLRELGEPDGVEAGSSHPNVVAGSSCLMTICAGGKSRMRLQMWHPLASQPWTVDIPLGRGASEARPPGRVRSWLPCVWLGCGDECSAGLVNLGDRPSLLSPPGGAVWLRSVVLDMVSDTVRARAGGQAGKLVASSGDADIQIIPMRGAHRVTSNGAPCLAGRGPEGTASPPGPPIRGGPAPRLGEGPVGTADAAGQLQGDNSLAYLLETTRRSFPSVILTGVVLTRGKWYYELEVIKPGLAQVGWCDVSFVGSSVGGQGVGDDKNSIAYDGLRLKSWFAGPRTWGAKWRAGDIIGCAVDVDRGTVLFSLNGSWELPMGIASEAMHFVGGAVPAVTAQHSMSQFLCKANMGDDGASSLRFDPPAGFLPVAAGSAMLGVAQGREGAEASLMAAARRRFQPQPADSSSSSASDAPDPRWGVSHGGADAAPGWRLRAAHLEMMLRRWGWECADGVPLPCCLPPTSVAGGPTPPSTAVPAAAMGLVPLSGAHALLLLDKSSAEPFVAGAFHVLDACKLGGLAPPSPLHPTSEASEAASRGAAASLSTRAEDDGVAARCDASLGTAMGDALRALSDTEVMVGSASGTVTAGLVPLGNFGRLPAPVTSRSWRISVRCISPGPTLIGFYLSEFVSRTLAASTTARGFIGIRTMSDGLWAAEQGLASRSEAESCGLVALGQAELSSIGSACQDCGFPKSGRQFEYSSALQAALKDVDAGSAAAKNALRLCCAVPPARAVEGAAWHAGCVAECAVTAARLEDGSFAWCLAVTINGREVSQLRFDGGVPSGVSGGLVPAVTLLPTSLVSVVSCAVDDHELA